MSPSSYNITRHSLESLLAIVLWTYHIVGYQENNNVINFAFHWHCFGEYEMKNKSQFALLQLESALVCSELGGIRRKAIM
jgi:hypothetical protein